MASTHYITLGSGLVLAIERNGDGADADIVRGYAHRYAMACFLGDEHGLKGHAGNLVSEAIKAPHRDVIPVTDMALELV